MLSALLGGLGLGSMYGLMALGFYVTHFACVDLGNKGTIPPLVAAWFPIAAFGSVGMVAFARMKT